MRPSTALNTWRKAKYDPEPIENPQSEAVRRSELETREGSNAKADALSTRADVARPNGEKTSSGANMTSPILARDASRIKGKKESKPMLQGEVDVPLSDPKQFGPAKVQAHDWRSRGYVKSAEQLGNYHKNSDRSQTERSLSKKSRAKKLD